MAFLKRHYMILAILLIGTVLRFWGIMDAGFHHDELSALLRTRFDDYRALIEQGVRVDGHPAFTQVFLWLWFPLVGATPWLIKLPFILSGILSIYLVYRIGSFLYSKPIGAIASAGMAVLQYGITYAQWARPYAFGVLAVLLAVFALLYFKKTGKPMALGLFSIAVAWAGYTHYFALLEVIVLSVLFFLFLLNKRERLMLMIASLVGALLWLPHLNITLHHLRLGGIGDWLEPAPLSFGLQLIAFAGHYSWWMAFPLVLGLLLLVLWPLKDRIYWRKLTVLFGAFLFPFLIAFYYSHTRSALLHEGTMIFAFPFFLLFVGALWHGRHRALQKLLATSVLFFGIYTLINERLYPYLNLNTEFNEPIAWFHQEKIEYEEQGATLAAFFDLRTDAVDWLDHHDVADYDQVNLFEEATAADWVERMERIDADALMLMVTAASEPEYLAVAQSLYPYIKAIHHYHTASCYLLERSPTGIESKRLLAVDHPMQSMQGKEFIETLIHMDTLRQPYTYLIGTAVFGLPLASDVKLVLDGEVKGKRYWRSVEAGGFKGMVSDQTLRMYQAVDLRDITKLGDSWELSLYPWNPSKTAGLVQSLSFHLIPSNPVRYGLFKAIPDKSLITTEGGKVKSLFKFEEKI